MNHNANISAAAEFLRRCLPSRPAGDGPTILTHLSDPGHGWLVVPRALAADVMGGQNTAAGGSGVSLFSPYSFEVPTASGPVLLLEEDCDASLFLALWKKQPVFGPVTVASVECPETIDVRSLPHCPHRTTTEEDMAASLLENAYREAERAARGADFDAATGAERAETFPGVRCALARLLCGLEGKDIPGVDYYEGILYDAAREMVTALHAADLIDASTGAA